MMHLQHVQTVTALVSGEVAQAIGSAPFSDYLHSYTTNNLRKIAI